MENSEILENANERPLKLIQSLGNPMLVKDALINKNVLLPLKALRPSLAMDFGVGLMDIDIRGPSIPKMLDLEGQEIHQSNLGWSPRLC
ncbi:hypothetical protein OIU85_012096 [Salix viminalis]|uniref:Uncharacterized protein n=1 Tax=Salix viminalis TaxID=40686 RepID=A0A9Q0SFL7_SALVM|nr:hypothetical protein OIU85_012096 [Salix viminalis]